MNNMHHHIVRADFILAAPFLIALFLYLFSVFHSNSCYKTWPFSRVVLFALGILCAVGSVSGPIAEGAHSNFALHMVGHLLLGMLSPLLISLSFPITLLLRTLPKKQARMLSAFLKSRFSRFFTHPVVATLLNVGGLWLLYTTNLYSMMHEHVLLHIFIHAHVFIAGYLFTISMIYFDPMSHRFSYLYRTIVLIFALAGHGILSKYIYAQPPNGVPVHEAELGGMIMYYGGDIIDALLIFLLCLQWFNSTKPRKSPEAHYA